MILKTTCKELIPFPSNFSQKNIGFSSFEYLPEIVMLRTFLIIFNIYFEAAPTAHPMSIYC